MAKLDGIKRASVIPRMRAALSAGKSASSFISDMRKRGLSYRRSTMLSDWRSVGNIEKKTGLLKFVRKGFQPSPALYADVTWQLSKEYLYKLKIHTKLRPGDPPDGWFVNIVSDRPLTPGEWEQTIEEDWNALYGETREPILKVEPILAVKRVRA
ncbi:hypothetical protein LCGC14_0974870 [marine sediment metagenome]|uniref:Uncharacterized protein n=1 Tax=marine sediment metagenome TaxID=412755 RepID=A0A0F9QTT2_9ZZZZ